MPVRSKCKVVCVTAQPFPSPPIRSFASTDGAVEEDLVEHGVARHLAQRTDGDSRLVQAEGEPRDPLVLRDVEVGAGQEHPVVGVPGLARPHLLPFDDPPVAVAGGAGRETGQIRARSGLAEQLAPCHLSFEQRRQMAGDLLGGAVGEDRGRGHQQPEPARRAQCPEGLEGRAHDGLGAPGETPPALLGGEVRCGPPRRGDRLPPCVDAQVRVPVGLEPPVDPAPHVVAGAVVRRGRRSVVRLRVTLPAHGAAPRSSTALSCMIRCLECPSKPPSSLTKSSGWETPSPWGQSDPKRMCSTPMSSARAPRSSSR